jgi:hypothetical protein
MGFGAPTAKDMFADASSPKEVAERMDGFTEAISKSVQTALTDPSQVAAVKAGVMTFNQAAGNQGALAMGQLESLASNKSLSPDALASLNSALLAQTTATNSINKEITLTSPLSSSFAAFDLEAPAKMLTPRPTPLRNRIPRKKGIGTAHRVKRILGYTGTGTGGQGNIWPGITETGQNNFAPGSNNPYYLIRGPQISYTADDLILPYNSYGLSDQVSFDANFSGQGYQDLRQTSSTSTLYATMLMEERMMLMARGTQSGYSGALAQPVIAAVTGVAKTATESQLANGQYIVFVTANAGIASTGFGESIVSAQAAETTTGTQVIQVTLTAPVVGALGYNLYVKSGSQATATYQGTFQGLTARLVGGTTVSTPNTIVYSTTGALVTRAAADTSAYATGYDGILPTVLGPNTGFNNAINSTFSTANPGVEFQTAFAAMYENVKADPDEVLLNGNDRKQLSDAIKNGSTANYRLMVENPGEGGITYGSVVTALQNEVTGKALALTVHPWLPQGVAPIISYTLPIPDTQVSDVWANFLVQDYMGIQWPVNQFTYDFSTYFRGTFFCTAPAWNGAVSNIYQA